MDFFKVLPLKKAKEIIISNLPNEQVIEVPLIASLGLVCAKNIYAPDYFPPYNRSIVDGYALSYKDTQCASENIPSVLKIVDTIGMGEMTKSVVKKDQAIAIPTGGVVPTGADAIVKIENTKVFKDELFVFAPLKYNENIVLKGEDISPSDIVVKEGDTLLPFTLGVLASLGVTTVKVYKPLKISIISTGDELVEITEKAIDGKIRDINTTLLSALVKEAGFDVILTRRTKDNQEELRQAIKDCLEVSDVVLISGGSSVGARDYTKAILDELGEVLIHGIAIKPGKPTMVAKVKDKLVYGLAGNPLASALTFKVLFRDLLDELRGKSIKPFTMAKANINFPNSPGRVTFQPVSLIKTTDGYLAEPIFMKSAHIASILKADGYVRIEDNEEGIYKGTMLEVYKL